MTHESAELDSLLHWFRDEWQAEMGGGRTTVYLNAEDGAPKWAERFKEIVLSPGCAADESETGRLPIRYHLQRFYRDGGGHNKRRALFLFKLACLGFDIQAAARMTSPAGWFEHGEAWAFAYTEVCLRRLHRFATSPEHVDGDGKPRRFLPRVGKSESQHNAEEAA